MTEEPNETANVTIFIPAISVVNGSKDSVIFIKVSDKFVVTADEARQIEATMIEKLKGSSLEGCKVFVTSGSDIEIVNGELSEIIA